MGRNPHVFHIPLSPTPRTSKVPIGIKNSCQWYYAICIHRNSQKIMRRKASGNPKISYPIRLNQRKNFRTLQTFDYHVKSEDLNLNWLTGRDDWDWRRLEIVSIPWTVPTSDAEKDTTSCFEVIQYSFHSTEVKDLHDTCRFSHFELLGSAPFNWGRKNRVITITE